MREWKVATTDDFDEWFRSLGKTAKGEDAQAEVIAKVELLKVFGPSLGRPHADTLKGSKHANMKELRASTADAVLRIAFAFDPNRSAILLCAGNKAGVSEKRFYRQLVDLADRLYAAHVEAMKADKRRKRN